MHGHDTPSDAEEDRKSCAKGSYRTTEPVEVDTVKIHGKEYVTTEELFKLLDEILPLEYAYVDYPEDEEDDEED